MTTQFDMFSGDGEIVFQKPARREPANRLPAVALSDDDMVEQSVLASRSGRGNLFARIILRDCCMRGVIQHDYHLPALT